MGIHVGFLPEGSIEQIEVRTMAAGDRASFSDFSSGEHRVVAVRCLEPGTVAEVFDVPYARVVAYENELLIPEAEMGVHAMVALVQAGSEHYEQHIVDGQRLRGRLVLSLIDAEAA